MLFKDPGVPVSVINRLDNSYEITEYEASSKYGQINSVFGQIHAHVLSDFEVACPKRRVYLHPSHPVEYTSSLMCSSVHY